MAKQEMDYIILKHFTCTCKFNIRWGIHTKVCVSSDNLLTITRWVKLHNQSRSSATLHSFKVWE